MEFVIAPLPTSCARRRWKKTGPFVIADGLNIHTAAGGQATDQEGLGILFMMALASVAATDVRLL